MRSISDIGEGQILSATAIGLFVVVAILVARLRCIAAQRRGYGGDGGGGHRRVVAFYHPRTRDGGGGERVLWCAVNAIDELVKCCGEDQSRCKHVEIVIYTGDEDEDGSGAVKLKDRSQKIFGINLHVGSNGDDDQQNHVGDSEESQTVNTSLSFSRVRLRKIAEPAMYPFMTILFQPW